MIELRGVRKEFSGVVALESIDLSVGAGEIHGIVGKSGAGKSTLIRCLTGLETPTSGTVVVDGVDLTTLNKDALRQSRRRIGMVFQHANLLDSRTALANVEHPLQIAGVPKAERRAKARNLLELVGLTGKEDHYPAQLSGGQQQRVGIARGLAADPQILLCDEPTSALDSATTAQILDLIVDLRDKLGITVLIITHEMAVVREVCDSVTLLENGRVSQTGTLADILSAPATPLAKGLVPLPEGVKTENTHSIEIGLAGTGLQDLLETARKAGAPITSVEAGTLETIDGKQVGRLRVHTESDAHRTTLIAALRAADIHVEEA